MLLLLIYAFSLVIVNLPKQIHKDIAHYVRRYVSKCGARLCVKLISTAKMPMEAVNCIYTLIFTCIHVFLMRSVDFERPPAPPVVPHGNKAQFIATTSRPPFSRLRFALPWYNGVVVIAFVVISHLPFVLSASLFCIGVVIASAINWPKCALPPRPHA